MLFSETSALAFSQHAGTELLLLLVLTSALLAMVGAAIYLEMTHYKQRNDAGVGQNRVNPVVWTLPLVSLSAVLVAKMVSTMHLYRALTLDAAPALPLTAVLPLVAGVALVLTTMVLSVGALVDEAAPLNTP
jgi:hypothetical protein